MVVKKVDINIFRNITTNEVLHKMTSSWTYLMSIIQVKTQNVIFMLPTLDENELVNDLA